MLTNCVSYGRSGDGDGDRKREGRGGESSGVSVLFFVFLFLFFYFLFVLNFLTGNERERGSVRKCLYKVKDNKFLKLKQHTRGNNWELHRGLYLQVYYQAS